jgi:hypothetical protein
MGTLDIVVIIILLIGLWMIGVKDTFVVAFNNDSVPKNPIKTIDNIQNDTLNKIFSIATPIDTDQTFALYNDNITFPLNKLFKSLALEYFNKNSPQFSKDKIYISNDMNNIYYKGQVSPPNDETKVQGGSILYICNFNLTNPKNLFTKNIKMGVSYNEQNGRGEVLFMKLDTLPDTLLTDSIDKLQPDYYTLKNNMFLMDPWITSNNSMTISDVYINNFNKVLKEKNKLLLNLTAVNGLITSNYQKTN